MKPGGRRGRAPRPFSPALTPALTLALTLALGAGAARGQCPSAQDAAGPQGPLIVSYAEPGLAGCQPMPATVPTAARSLRLGVAVPGRIAIGCGLDQGSYTVTLRSSGGEATFAPPAFIVNFGRVVGSGAFTATFSTPGVHHVIGSITPNMGSPVVRGQFAAAPRQVCASP